MSEINIADSSRVACVIPVRNGGEDLKSLLALLAEQTIPVDLFIIDSESSDDSVSVAQSHGAKVNRILVDNFDHGDTRQYMVDQLDAYEFCIFLTQDALPASSRAIATLLSAFDNSCVAAAYGRQLPKADSTPFAAFLRYFNYPVESRVQSLESVSEQRMKTVFISNSFAAYRRSALQAVGGFPRNAILGEDISAAARLISSGWHVAYVAEAECFHSHNYTLLEEWRRYFDIGVFYGREHWIQSRFGGAEKEGFRFVHEELRFLGKKYWYLWPLSIIRNAGKFLFYKLGQKEKHLPLWLKLRLSMHRRFWLR